MTKKEERDLERFNKVLATYDLDELADLVATFGDDIDGTIYGYEEVKLNAKRMSLRIRNFNRKGLSFKGVTRRWGIRGQVCLLDFYKEYNIK